MEKVVSREVAEIVANWWAEKVCQRKRFDNGDDSESGVMASMFATMLAKPVTDEQRERFVKALADRIEGKEIFCLDCDYHPSKELMESAKEANISEFNFPWKTFTMMERHYQKDEGYTIWGRYGYTGEREILYECT